ncbi:phenylalanine 4-monooxygenase [Balamuthia mandrillaris]
MQASTHENSSLPGKSKERVEDSAAASTTPAAPPLSDTGEPITLYCELLKHTHREDNAKQAIVTVPNKVGALKEVLEIFQRYDVNLGHIESRPNNAHRNTYDLCFDFVIDDASVFQKLLQTLEDHAKKVVILNKGAIDKPLSAPTPDSSSSSTAKEIPWFPRRIADLDLFAERVLEFGEELDADHPGFLDPEYRKRRANIVRVAKVYRHGERIPRVEYTDQEKETWRTVYRKLTSMYPSHACAQHNYIFPLLEQNCGYSEDNIPQLQDISDFLQDCTGWRLRPVMGLLSPRDFLNGLAFRVFHSTQYIRHHSKPFYTPEPDVCHELLGHVPLFADPAFADFSQEIGLASLGASDEDIEKLATCYWFTVEFGLCRQNGELRAYGAGLLSSFGELEYCLTSDKAERRNFNPFETCKQKYPITTFQPLYYVADSFEKAKNQMRNFAQTALDRPFAVRYNPYTQSVDVLDTKAKLIQLSNTIQSDAALLSSALNFMS